MPSLYDVINKNAAQQSSAQAPMQDETLRTRKLLQAKSGRSLSEATEAPISSLQEQSANAATTSGLQQVGQQAQLQAQQLGQAEEQVQQQVGQQQRGIEQQKRFDTIENRLQTDQLLQNLEQSRGKLDVMKDKASKEQIASNLRLQSQEYIDNLQRAAASARLDDAASFQDQLLRDTLGDNESLLRQKLGDNAFLGESEREWKKRLAQMNADSAYDVFKDDLKALKNKAMYEGITGATKGGIGAFSKSGGGD